MIFSKEPAFWIGVVAGCVLAIVHVLNTNGLASGNAVDIVNKAIDPTSGWLIPIVTGIFTRFFVSPADKVGV